MKTNIYNIIILDESGSMSSIKPQAINGYNETVQTIRAAQTKHVETQQHFVTLVSFNSSRTNTISDKAPVEQAKELNNNTYLPDCCTPLYDAMGITLNKFRYTLDENADNKILVTIITDGEENASMEYNGAAIKKLVEELKAKGWVFTYIGANQDVAKVAATISITNTMSFEASDSGTKAMFKKSDNSRMNWFDRVANEESSESLLDNFFTEE